MSESNCLNLLVVIWQPAYGASSAASGTSRMQLQVQASGQSGGCSALDANTSGMHACAASVSLTICVCRFKCNSAVWRARRTITTQHSAWVEDEEEKGLETA